MPFHVPKSNPALTDHVGSIVALALLIASWATAYVTICPADVMPARLHVAQVQP